MRPDTEPLERYREIVDDWGALTEALARPLPLCVWANTLRASVEDVERWLVRCGLELTPLGWCPGAWRVEDPGVELGTLLPYLSGLIHIQEEASLLPSLVLRPAPGERILDTCAAPGGKAAHIAVQMRNQGTLVANDRSHARSRALRSIIDRLGLLNTTMLQYDAANLPRDVGTFDRALVDAPCSCEGTSRKNPRALEVAGELDHGSLGRLQRAITRRALEQLRPGGLLAYSTCTYAPEENECVVQDVLESFDQGRAELVPIELPGFQAGSGLVSWQGRAFVPEMKRALRVWPHHQDTGGFFVALIRRTA